MTGALQLLLEIFANDLLPVFAIAGAGFLLARFAGVQVHGVSRLTLHVLAPALVFNVLVTSTLDAAQSSRMALFYLLVATSAAVMAQTRGHPTAARPSSAQRVHAGRGVLERRQLRAAGRAAGVRPRGTGVCQRVFHL